ncbi:MAG: type II toxin-antitoxin system VapC family toxin [bacterium]
MEQGVILETTFLIDLEREVLAGDPGPAHEFLQTLVGVPVFITFTVAGEMACGVEPDERPVWERLISDFDLLTYDQDVCWRYGMIYRYLREQGLLIGTNDLWIAATALANAMPVVTSNVREFRRVPGLRVMSYRD